MNWIRANEALFYLCLVLLLLLGIWLCFLLLGRLRIFHRGGGRCHFLTFIIPRGRVFGFGASG